MDAVVIPYFLGLTSLAALNNTVTRSPNGTDYESGYGPNYGPVYTFDVEIDFLKSPERNLEPDFVQNFTSTLKCRPRNTNVLSCTLEDRKMSLTDYKLNVGFRKVQSGKECFEIYYNEAGVESLRISSSKSSVTTSDKRYDLIRDVASQLNVGMNFFYLYDLHGMSYAFIANDTSTLGKCETFFTVSTFPCTERAEGQNLRMITILHKSLGDSIILRKKRNTKMCERPTSISLLESTEFTLSSVTSSFSEMRFCQDSFESSTIVEGKLLSLQQDAQTSVFQKIVKVRLENVERAEEKLPTFTADTATDKIYLHKDVDRNNFET